MVLDLSKGQGVKWQGEEAQIIEILYKYWGRVRQYALLYIPEKRKSVRVTVERLYRENPDLVVVQKR